MMNATLRGKPNAGNPHVRFDEGEVASVKPRRGSLLYKKLVLHCLALTVGVYAASAFAEEIDISKSVREADAGTTLLQYGGSHAGYTLDNAFGEEISKESRVLLSNVNNRIVWTISPSFATNQPVIMTSYTIRRAWFQGAPSTPDTENGNDSYSRRRAPKAFVFQASSDGSYWVDLDRRKDVPWVEDGDMEKTFEVDPVAFGDYRKYRFVVTATAAKSDDVAKCSFQYIKVNGTVADPEPLARLNRKLDHMVSRDCACSAFKDIKLSYDSRVELDIALIAVDGTRAIYTSSRSGAAQKMRLFHLASDGWWFQYGSKEVKTGIKAYPGARYKIVADGPVLAINGVTVADLGEKKTGEASNWFSLFGSPSDGGDTLYNTTGAQIWSVKVYDGNGSLVHDLQPVLHHDGGARFYDAKTGRMYVSDSVSERLRMDYATHKWLGEFNPGLGNLTITQVEGKSYGGDYTVSNAFTSVVSLKDRALFTTKRNVIQYDIHDDYHPKYPIVFARYAVLPCLAISGQQFYAYERSPTQFELQASKDGTNDWITLSKVTIGLGAGSYANGGGVVGKSIDDKLTDLYGSRGVVVDIPEENRGDYRHYRFITNDSHGQDYDSIKVGFQCIKFFGYDGGFEQSCEPVEHVQNAYDEQKSNHTYFKTGVVPTACDLTIEIKGSFTRVDQTHCLFCSRDSNAAKTWTLFLLDGALRLDCGASGSKSSFKPVKDKVYTFKVEQNRLFVDDTLVYTSGTTNFVPGSEIVLLASHKAANSNWDNQARFKLQSCKITDSFSGVIRDYVAAKRSDGTAGIYERSNASLNSWFCASSGTGAISGEPIDTDFHQRERSVSVVSELENGTLPRRNVGFSFGNTQRLMGKLYAALDNGWKGNDTSAWAKVVELADVKTGVDSLTVGKIPNPDHYSHVKFFVCDSLERGVSQTKTYRTSSNRFLVIIR